MYKNYVVKRAPTALFMLDDTVPFQEHTGLGATGGKKSGTSDPTIAVPLVAGAAFSSVFKSTSVGQFACNLFKQGLETRRFVLEAWVLPIPKTTTGVQQILSNNNVYDGLTIDGKVIRFGTSYLTTGNAYCDYDLQVYKEAHVVGIHSEDENQLWVNGNLVASVEITDEQKADKYIATDGNLYSGGTASDQELAMNAVAFYPSLSGDQILQNYTAGIETIGQERVIAQYGGMTLGLDAGTGAVFLEESWVDKDDFETGLKTNVEYAEDQINPGYVADVSVAGSWTTSVPLDVEEDTSIYGVMVEWSGKAITVDTSLDGTTWAAASNGKLVASVTNGYDPTGKDLQIRVNFAGGLAADPAYLESLSVVGFRNNTINTITARPTTISYPAVPRGDYEPTLHRDDNGVYLNGGTLTIGADTSVDPEVVRTIEVWVKPLSGVLTRSWTVTGGQKYANSVLSADAKVGEWTLLHFVLAADTNAALTMSGDLIVGQVTLYPVALTAADVLHVYNSYYGRAQKRFTDPGVVTVSEGATPTKVYVHDWAIDSGG